MSKASQSAWPKGINNQANWRNLPDGTVRDAVNLDASPDGLLSLRTGYAKVYDGSQVRGALALSDDVLLADAGTLVRLDTHTNTASALRTIAAVGRFVGDVLNAELFLCTENECLRYQNGRVRAWGVPTVTAQPLPARVTGALPAGTYQLAMTWINAQGEEGGTRAAVRITVPADSGLTVTLPALDGHIPHLYVSAANGATLYWQASGAGSHTVNAVADDTRRLDTQHLDTPRPGTHVAAHNGSLAVADGRTLWLTAPLMPHLVRRSSGFFRFAEPIDMVLSASGGLYVSADKTYFLADAEGDAPIQREVSPYPAIPGTGAKLRDGRAAWMTPHGLAVSTPDGLAALVSQDNFAPQLATAGATGTLNTHGNQMAITTVRTSRGANPMAASDYYEAEIVYP